MKSTAVYGERTLNLVMPGLDGLEKMRALMAQLRREPLQEIAGTQGRAHARLSGRLGVRHGPRKDG